MLHHNTGDRDLTPVSRRTETDFEGLRHVFTVRLRLKDYRALMGLAVEAERTYQDILETAIRHYLNRSVDAPEADTERVAPH